MMKSDHDDNEQVEETIYIDWSFVCSRGILLLPEPVGRLVLGRCWARLSGRLSERLFGRLSGRLSGLLVPGQDCSGHNNHVSKKRRSRIHT
jgi:hypothetical protein